MAKQQTDEGPGMPPQRPRSTTLADHPSNNTFLVASARKRSRDEEGCELAAGLGPERSFLPASSACDRVGLPLLQPDLLCLIGKESTEVDVFVPDGKRVGVTVDQTTVRCATERIQTLNTEMKMGPKGVRLLCEALVGGAFPNLLTLSFTHAGIGDEGLKAFAPLVANGSLGSLVELRVQGNRIGDVGMAAFAGAIGASGAPMANCQLITLNNNQIGDVGMQAFSDAIRSGSLLNLVDLNLAYNQIGDAGVQALAGAIASGAMGSLRSLWLHKNRIGDAGMQAFAASAGALAKLTDLHLDGNNISDPGMVSLSDAIARGALASISFIDLDYNKATETVKKQMRDVAEARGFHVDLA